MSEIIVRFKPKQMEVLKAIGELILIREEEENNNKKTNVNTHAVSKISGLDFKTCKKYLKQLRNL